MLKIVLSALTYFSVISLISIADMPTLKSASLKDIILTNRTESNNTPDVVISTDGGEQKNTLKALALSGGENTKTEIKIKNDITNNEDGSKTTIQKVIVNGKEQTSNIIEGSPSISKEEKGSFKQEVKGNDIYLTMDKKYEISKDTTIKAEQLKLKEGDKNIYINFTPEIKIAGNCGQCGNNTNNTTTASYKNNKQQIKNGTKQAIAKKLTSKTKTKSYTSAKKKKKKTKIQSMDDFLQNDEKEVKKVLASSRQKDNGGMASLDCVDGCQTDIYASSIKNDKTNSKPQVKVVKKDEPIYVINRIIQVDDDTNLTEENIEKLVKSGDAIVAVQQIGGNTRDQSRIGAFRTADSLKSAYIANSIVNYRENDVVDKTHEAYGEIAFVDADEYD